MTLCIHPGTLVCYSPEQWLPRFDALAGDEIGLCNTAGVGGGQCELAVAAAGSRTVQPIRTCSGTGAIQCDLRLSDSAPVDGLTAQRRDPLPFLFGDSQLGLRDRKSTRLNSSH